MPNPSASDPGGCSILCFLFIGTLLGTVGQIARVAAGLKKETDNPQNAGKKYSEWFDMGEFVVSLLIGAAAGAMVAIALMGTPIDKRFLVACITAGYAGADFVGAFMANYVSGASGGGSAGTNPAGKTTPPDQSSPQHLGDKAAPASPPQGVADASKSSFPKSP